MPKEPTVKVLILGSSRAGKSTYLAGLYTAMATPQTELTMRLRIDEESAAELQNAYREVILPNADWPGYAGGEGLDL